ncbi:SDR family NAD(P)-dependent oxidoreductase [Flavobacterium sp. NKUCC04_CG]|uniref:SDR family NAD(P)-dependent oxidoreductase n=1 Tax=Flavobacterium sp. NKUCC04_CG TaxID=2842121 RepID=UPI0021084FE8|nr:SDR family oxidoreductase [Flavobacterium sp. NKUCC04_CG]
MMLSNKYAVVTGGSDGIGLAIATAFVKEGAHVCIVGRNQLKLQEARENLAAFGKEVVCLAFDLTQVNEIKVLAAQILTVFPRVDVLVNNAGMGHFSPFLDTDTALLEMHLDLNVKAPYFLTQNLMKSLIESGGNVINISSYFSHRMLPGRDSTAYSLTKGALDSFTKALAFEVGKRGVRINGIAPGSIQTDLFQTNLEKLTVEEQRTFEVMVGTIYPLGKIGVPDDIGSMAVFLASDSAKWITGAMMAVDGGLTTN